MVETFQTPAQAAYWLISGRVLFLIINLLGLACFAYIVAKRLTPLLRGERDVRFDRPLVRLGKLAQFWLGQWKHPRYSTAGIIHILIFAGFILLATRAFSLLILGISENFVTPGSSGAAGHMYEMITDYAATIVFACMVIAAVRRIVFKPARYEVPAKYGKGHTVDAIFLLALIALLMLSESVFEASKVAFLAQQGHTAFLAALSLPWMLKNALSSASLPALWNLHLGAYLAGCADLLLPAVLSAVWNSVPRRDVAVQRVLRQAGPGNGQAGALGRQRRATRSGEIVRREEVRGLHLEAHARLLFLRRLRTLLGQLSSQCGGAATVAAVPHYQGAGLRLPALPGVRQGEQQPCTDRRHLLRRRNLVVHYLRRMRRGVPAADRVHRQDRRSAARHGR